MVPIPYLLFFYFLCRRCDLMTSSSLMDVGLLVGDAFGSCALLFQRDLAAGVLLRMHGINIVLILSLEVVVHLEQSCASEGVVMCISQVHAAFMLPAEHARVRTKVPVTDLVKI